MIRGITTSTITSPDHYLVIFTVIPLLGISFMFTQFYMCKVAYNARTQPLGSVTKSAPKTGRLYSGRGVIMKLNTCKAKEKGVG